MRARLGPGQGLGIPWPPPGCHTVDTCYASAFGAFLQVFLVSSRNFTISTCPLLRAVTCSVSASPEEYRNLGPFWETTTGSFLYGFDSGHMFLRRVNISRTFYVKMDRGRSPEECRKLDCSRRRLQDIFSTCPLHPAVTRRCLA